MKKKILIGVGAVVLFVAVAFFYLNYRNYQVSPRGEAELNNGGLSVKITYCRPSARGRVIFGEESQKALQPYGKYWRLGANESTEITFSDDVNVNGTLVKKGTYRLYAIPGKTEFELVLNSELGVWGYFEPDTKKDILRTKVPVQAANPPAEQFTILMAPQGTGVDVIFEWTDVRFVLPVTK